MPTTGAAEGPLYPTEAMRFADIGTDLVKIAGLVRQAVGEELRSTGRVLDGAGAPALAV